MFRAEHSKCSGRNTANVQVETQQMFRAEHSKCSWRNTANVHGGTQQMFRAEHSKCSGRNTANVHGGTQQMFMAEHSKCSGRNTANVQGGTQQIPYIRHNICIRPHDVTSQKSLCSTVTVASNQSTLFALKVLSTAPADSVSTRTVSKYGVIRNDCQGFNNLSYTINLR